jgi:kynureninase
MTSLDDCRALDARDPLRHLRDLFALPDGVVYLDGNSLGALPRSAAARVAQVVQAEWGVGLIRSWNDAAWIKLPQRVGDKIARLVGAKAGEVVCADSTSVNVFKVLSAAIGLVQARTLGNTSDANNSIANNDHMTLTLASKTLKYKKTILSERSNFPTDLYIAQSLAAQHGMQLQLVESDGIAAALTDEVAVLLLTHVHYRSGAVHDMAALTAKAHAVGALAVWDLAHSAGALPVDLHGANADFAVGCGYKYLNGGPGAPAFVWVHPRHLSADSHVSQPLAGWMGHAAPFAFTPNYAPAAGINAYLCGTPSVIGLAALECGVDTVLAACPRDAAQGMAALRAKSLALTDLFIQLVGQRCADFGLQLATPIAHAQRGSQVSYAIAGQPTAMVQAVMQALIARGVVGDFRAGDASAPAGSSDRLDILRFGFTPLYVGYCDVWQAVEQLRAVLAGMEWQRPAFMQQKAVT